MNKTYPLSDYYTGKHIADYTFESEPQTGDKVQPAGIGGATYTVQRCWEKGQLVIKLVRPGVRQASIVSADRGSVISGVTQTRG